MEDIGYFGQSEKSGLLVELRKEEEKMRAMTLHEFATKHSNGDEKLKAKIKNTYRNMPYLPVGYKVDDDYRRRALFSVDDFLAYSLKIQGNPYAKSDTKELAKRIYEAEAEVRGELRELQADVCE